MPTTIAKISNTLSIPAFVIENDNVGPQLDVGWRHAKRKSFHAAAARLDPWPSALTTIREQAAANQLTFYERTLQGIIPM